MKLWIARDKDGLLNLYYTEPQLVGDCFAVVYNHGYGYYIELGYDVFPEVIFENSPQEVELKLCHQTETIKMEDCNPKALPCVLTNHGIDTNVVKFD